MARYRRRSIWIIEGGFFLGGAHPTATAHCPLPKHKPQTKGCCVRAAILTETPLKHLGKRAPKLEAASFKTGRYNNTCLMHIYLHVLNAKIFQREREERRKGKGKRKKERKQGRSRNGAANKSETENRNRCGAIITPNIRCAY